MSHCSHPVNISLTKLKKNQGVYDIVAYKASACVKCLEIHRTQFEGKEFDIPAYLCDEDAYDLYQEMLKGNDTFFHKNSTTLYSNLKNIPEKGFYANPLKRKNHGALPCEPKNFKKIRLE
jgi:hypothetical protein